MTIWRDGAEKTLRLATVGLDGRDIDRILIWAGATLQAPHRAMAVQRGIAPYGVFVSFFFYGSPATHYGLYAGRRITEVDGQPTPDLDAFIKAVGGKPDRASLRKPRHPRLLRRWHFSPSGVCAKTFQAAWRALIHMFAPA